MLKKEEIGMITKVSCYTQTFAARGLPMSRGGAICAKTGSHQGGLSVSEFNQLSRRSGLHDAIGVGGLVGTFLTFVVGYKLTKGAVSWCGWQAAGTLVGAGLGKALSMLK